MDFRPVDLMLFAVLRRIGPDHDLSTRPVFGALQDAWPDLMPGARLNQCIRLRRN